MEGYIGFIIKAKKKHILTICNFENKIYDPISSHHYRPVVRYLYELIVFSTSNNEKK